MKTKLLTLFLLSFSLFVFSQEKLFNYTEEIQSTDERVKQTSTFVQQEFGEPTSPGIWTSDSSDYGLMIRTKGSTFYVRAWQISPSSNIKSRIDRLMAKVNPILQPEKLKK